MIDHLVGKPNPSWKRTQVFLVILFWTYRILRGESTAPRYLWLRKANRALSHFTPWQLVASTLTGVYAVRNLDKILGLGSPEPLARLYSPSYYRATWINTGLDAGFATAMSIRPKWLNDIFSVLFSIYYIIYANEADEKLRKFRAVPTIEMLRTTWEKTTNPYISFITNLRLPRPAVKRKILLPRPKSSTYERPITAWLFFAPPEEQLSRATDLILDFPGGGFVAMSPAHHVERLHLWAKQTGKPILSLEYGKAPEYPYPFAIDEAYDIYRLLVDSAGTAIGMSGRKFNVIISGDSAGATLAVSVMIKILEHNTSTATTFTPHPIPPPLSLVLNYAALDFNFTSWMSPSNLRVLRSEQSSGNLPGMKQLAMQKDHLANVSPLSMVGDKRRRAKPKMKRHGSWRDTIRGLTQSGDEDAEKSPSEPKPRRGITPSASRVFIGRRERGATLPAAVEDRGVLADAESESEEDYEHMREEDRPIEARIRHVYPHIPAAVQPLPTSAAVLEKQQEKLSAAVAVADTRATSGGKEPRRGDEGEHLGTRLTMTSRTGYFQDRIISPSMMRAMAILYIGPHRNPDFATDYHISPILAPSHLLAQFPPLLMQCGEKDPFVDDTVIFAGRVREAKRARKVELDLAIAGKSARFGEGLRMSVAVAEPLEGARLQALKKERDQLARETEEDWVQMVLFSDWSHGYLQMSTLMTEARAVIDDLGDWIDEAFLRYSPSWQHRTDEPPVFLAAARSAETRRPSATGKTRPSFGPTSSKVAPSPFTSETETDDTAIHFVPKPKRFRSPTHSSGMVPEALAGDHRQGSSGSEQTLHDDALGTSTAEATGAEDGDAVDGKGQHRAGWGTPVGKKAGETISETELMRRRRLLDAHIFE
ncbi:alpha/beta-hydrolase [Athelia psychrophila]|uniref:Alpha/beta-hydrolase n=1 Tax=Athelia psychrophila TaxID=1759441 RepID=A0A166X2K9_9AGAM|nr:alpha/beta-hydrolase [Fibularhizoctonia sp. CBS 109695]